MACKVKDVMTRNLDIARPNEPVWQVARRMAEGDFGFEPVVEGRRLIGAITDRDLTIRVLAARKDPNTPVGEVMTREASWVHEDADCEEVLDKMADEQIRRMPVVDKMGELLGVVSIGDLTGEVNPKHAGSALKDICQPRGAGTFS